VAVELAVPSAVLDHLIRAREGGRRQRQHGQRAKEDQLSD
jgi:hypothetical protein